MRVFAFSFAAALLASACAVGETSVEPAADAEVMPGSSQGNDLGSDGTLPLAPPVADEPNQASVGDGHAPSTGSAPPEEGNVVFSGNYTLRVLGRVTADTNLVSWPGPVAELSFRGTEGSFALTAARGFVAVLLDIDGETQPPVVVKSASTTLSFGPLPDGPHTVVLTKLSEAYLGVLRLGDVQTNGRATAPAAPARRLLFIGDSITAGFGVRGTAPCTNDTATQDVTSAYAGLVAKALRADYAVLAWSGMGLLRNLNPTVVVPALTMSSYWRRQNATQATPSFVPNGTSAPQVVVIALGTNDFRAQPAIDDNDFVAAYVAFIGQIALAYPEAKFVLSASPLLLDSAASGATALRTNSLADLNRVVARVGNKAKVANVPALSAALRGGCGGHPNEAGQQVIAGVVAGVVKQQGGW